MTRESGAGHALTCHLGYALLAENERREEAKVAVTKVSMLPSWPPPNSCRRRGGKSLDIFKETYEDDESFPALAVKRKSKRVEYSLVKAECSQ